MSRFNAIAAPLAGRFDPPPFLTPGAAATEEVAHRVARYFAQPESTRREQRKEPPGPHHMGTPRYRLGSHAPTGATSAASGAWSPPPSTERRLGTLGHL